MKTFALNIISGIKKLVYLASPEGELVSYPAKNNTASEKKTTAPGQEQEPVRQEDAEKKSLLSF